MWRGKPGKKRFEGIPPLRRKRTQSRRKIPKRGGAGLGAKVSHGLSVGGSIKGSEKDPVGLPIWT